MIGLLILAAMAAPEPEPRHLELHRADAPLLVGLVVYSFGAATRANPRRRAGRSNPATLSGIDRWLVQPEPMQRRRAASLSDVFGTVGSVPIAFGLGVAYGAVQGFRSNSRTTGLRRGTAFSLIAIEALGVSYALNDIVKHTVRRPRPPTYGSSYAGGTQEDELSFYSGHTSTAGTWSFFAAHSFVRSGAFRGAWRAAPYLGALGVTATTGYLRVHAGRHFPTDVLAGGAIGATIGILVAELHLEPDSGLSISRSEHGWRADWRTDW